MLDSSKIVKEHVIYYPPIYTFAEWILPKILAVPTPTAIPLYLVSIKFAIPHFYAQAYDMIVLYAPESTNAINLCLLIIQFKNSIQTGTYN